ncbi:MAG: hypothetical protein ACUVQ6_00820 [Dissulfurimicrobium sp.]|uniref:hypothetical protein n=1 Tax=Dissulfurimicrobium sp. TaxID=2022436 RepID=UPI00404A962A
MKIDIHEIGPANKINGPAKKDTRGAIDTPFSIYMEKQLAKDHQGDVSTVNQIPSTRFFIDPLTATMPLDMVQTTAQANAISLGNNTLGVLEHLSSLLATPGTGSNTLNSLAEALSRQIEDIKNARNSLAQNDPLRDILDAIGAVSAVEIAKIKNGDY